MNASGPRERATFTLSPETRRRLETTVPKSERSRFVEEAVELALANEAKRKAIDAIRNFPRVINPAGDSADFIREMRAGREAYLAARQERIGK